MKLSKAILSQETEEVYFFIAKCIFEKLEVKIDCESCDDQLSRSTVRKNSYFDLFTRGVLQCHLLRYRRMQRIATPL